jgi:ATP-binding cassette subfamily F protein 3
MYMNDGSQAMIVLQASHVQKQYDGNLVLKDATLVVKSKDRVALVGANGAGKTTLLRILVGLESADSGEVSFGKDVSVGYVAQYMDADDDVSVFDFVAASFHRIRQMEAELHALEATMARPDVYADSDKLETITARYARLQQAFDDAGGYAIEARVRRVLDGLAFPPAMHTQPVKSLSGGQKTRLSLARLLATEPDLLVLDEPTNYLDTTTLSWLEDYLRGYPGAVLVVSHDRYFLDQVTTVTYELQDGTTTRYEGNYSAYVEEKAARLEQAMKRYEAQQQEIQRIETFIQKNIARASTTKRAQSRRKLLMRMERLERPHDTDARMAVRFACARPTGRDVLRLEGLVVGYPGRPLAGPLDLHVLRGQRLAIIGPNGIGKSTLLKTLVGQIPPLAGTMVWGQHVDVGYYDQEQEDLDDDKTVLAQIHDEFPHLDLTTVRTALGRFLFRGEDVQRKVAGLSGGERSRLALCRLMLRQANVLVFDEPTNHLDLISKEVLEDALTDYEGTLIFVSHDRYFIDALATHVLRIDESGHRLYIGNYTDYLEKRADEEKWGTGAGPEQTTPTSGAKSGRSDETQRTEHNAAKTSVRSADLRKLRNRVTDLEEQISAIEAEQQALAAAMVEAADRQDYEAGQRLQADHERLEAEHQRLLQEWEELAEELEALEQQAKQ